MEKSKHDKKRNALKDEKQRDSSSSKKRKIEISAAEEKANVRVAKTPPGKRVELSKAMRDLFGTTSDDDEERHSEPSRSSVTKKENSSWAVPKPQINSAKNEDMKKSKNKDSIEKITDAPENDKNKVLLSKFSHFHPFIIKIFWLKFIHHGG